MKISSPAFSNKGVIPSKYTCDSENVNPPLTFKNIPAQTKSLALIMDDPDSPSGTWSHWIAWNIDPAITDIPENNTARDYTEGVNDFALAGYGGPCPNAGEHRYEFKLYALDAIIDNPPATTKTELEQALKPYIIAQAKLVGKYERQ